VLTNDKQLKRDPAWSADGTRLAFVRGGPGDGEIVLAFELGGDIWLANRNGGARTNLTNTPTIAESSPSWSADGGALTFAARSSNGTDALHTWRGGPISRFVVSTDHERPFVQASVDWQPVRVLVATVSHRRPIVSMRDVNGRQVKTLRAGLYAFAIVDPSRRHSIVWPPEIGTSARFVGRHWPSLEGQRLTEVGPGLRRFWCPVHPRERGSYRVFDQA
jgi:dipeptidyl aminopeptidase/acylaminoacyl peptidase